LVLGAKRYCPLVQYNNRDPRLTLPNFYYDQEDFRERQQGKAWHWTALRPEATTGFGLGNPMNLGMWIAVYAVISKELRLPLRFPGTKKGYWDFKSNHVGRHSQPVRGGQGDFQHQWHLFPSEIPSAGHCRDVRHGDGPSYPDTFLSCVWPKRSPRGRLWSDVLQLSSRAEGWG
jgi:hypothetical protein